MTPHLDNELKTYFSHKEDVPLTVKNKLRAKLYEYKAKEKLSWLWIIVPCFAIITLIMFTVIYAALGLVGVAVLLAAYYVAASVCGAAIVITKLSFTKNRKVIYS